MMKITRPNPSPKIIWFSLLINSLICFVVLPRVLQPQTHISFKQFGEVLFFQFISLIGWPIPFMAGLAGLLWGGTFPGLVDLLILLIYPAGTASFVLTLILKNKWIPLIITHILILISFLITWNSTLNGYNFMIG
jgi:hypothetical protein